MNKLTYLDLSLNLDSRLLYKGDEEIHLTKTEYNLLKFFLENKGKVFSREEIINTVWINNKNDRAADVIVSRLRKKLNDDRDIYIHSSHGYGYGIIEK